MTLSKTFEFYGEIIERCPEITKEEAALSIEDIDELYTASKITPEEMAEMFHLPINYVLLHYDDYDLEWLSEYNPVIDG